MRERKWIHLTARLSADAPPLTLPDTGQWLWSRLREAFPSAISVTLMPDHPHLVCATIEPESAAERLARLLGQFGRRFGVRGQVSRVASVEVIRPGPVLARQVRYVALNPCRAGLARCPLAWPWSTYRDVIGATLDPWVTAERLAHALAVGRRDFIARHHAYVSSDPHAAVAGTPLPIAAVSSPVSRHPLETIVEAVRAATRSSADAIHHKGPTRALFVALAVDQGWSHAATLAAVCGCCPHTIRRLAGQHDPSALQVARLCLGDARLRIGFTDHERTQDVWLQGVKPSLGPNARILNVARE